MITYFSRQRDVNTGREPVIRYLHRGFYMSAPVVLNLLNKLGKEIKMQGLSSIIENDFSYFLTKNICFGYSKEPSQ